MSPTKIPSESIFGTWRQFMMPLCSICPDGSPPCSQKQPQFFHLPSRPSLSTPCYSSGLISFSFSHSFCSRHTDLQLQGLCTCYSSLSAWLAPSLQLPCSWWGLPWPPGFALSPLPILLRCFAFLHLIYQPLTLFVMTNRIGLSHS